MFEKGDIVHAVILGVADPVDEVVNPLGRIATAAHPAKGRHAWVVPSRHQLLLHQLEELALAHHRVSKVQAVELDLTGAVVTLGQLINEPVVERAVHLKLECAERVRHPLEVVRLSVGKVIHRVNFPGGAGAMVRDMDHAVDDRVTEVHVGGGHVDPGTQHHLPLGDHPAVHLLEELKRLFNRSVAIGTVGTGLSGCTFLTGDLLGRLFIDIGLALFDQFHGEIPKLLKVVGSIENIAPLVAQPFDILHDGVHILHILFHRIGVVEAEVADPSIFFSNAEINDLWNGHAVVD